MQTEETNTPRYAQSYPDVVSLQKSPEDIVRLARLQYHLSTGDYFALLATVLGILEESLIASEAKEEEMELLRMMRKDLVYLQQTYRITPAS